MSTPIVTEKTCGKCGETKPLSKFRADARMRSGYRNTCVPCVYAQRKEWRTTPEGKAKVAALAKHWREETEQGRAYWYERSQTLQAKRDSEKDSVVPYQPLSYEEYKRRLSEQGGVCGICNMPPDRKRLALDHCHKTGKSRGLLCCRCNFALGYLNDSTDLLKAAIHYLLSFS